MPSMSKEYHAYLAPDVENAEDVAFYRENIKDEVEELQRQCSSLGLKRGIHYSLRPLSETEISNILTSKDFVYPCELVLCEIYFRNRRRFDAFMNSDFAERIPQA